MSWLTNTLKNRRMMVAIGFTLLILLILIIGALRLGDSGERLLTLTERILCIVLVLLVALMLFMYERMQEISSAKGMEQAFFSQAEDQKQSLTPSKRREIEAFQKKLEAAIDALKRSKIGRGRRGAAALYALPWYLMIGPPGGGKSTAIKNSGLDFPAGVPKDDEVYGVGGTRNCEWFLSTEAILLDTAGRFVSVDEDREEWLTFLDILKKYRRKKPINGVLVGFSVKDLLEADAETLDQQAKKIRERIDELSKRLGIHFPVYLVFTKSDLLDGFADFFGDMNSREREQIWGCTYTQEQMKAAAADPRAVFNEELQTLLDSLTEMRTARLHSAVKRRRVFLFPLQLAAVREKMAHFVGRLFQPNPYQDNPVCRGYYLTSATQNEGVPLDRAVEAISREFGLPPLSAASEAETAADIKHYFIRDLFTNVVIPDQNFLIGGTSRMAQAQRRLRLATMAGAALVLALFIIGVSFDYNNSKNSMNALNAAADSLRGVNAGSADYFDRLQGLRAQLTRQESQSIFGLGMGRRGTVSPPAYKLYFDRLMPFAGQQLHGQLAARLNRVSNNLPGADLGSAYDDLKAYLLLTREHRRMYEERHKIFLKEKFLGLLDPQLSSSAQSDAEFFASHFAEAVEEKWLGAFPANEATIAGAREVLGKPNVYNHYQLLKGQVKDVPAVSFAESSLRSPHRVAGVYTLAGWNAMEELIRQPLGKYNEEQQWVLGSQAAQATNSNSQAMTAQLKKLYFNDYAKEWGKFLREVEYEPFANPDDAAEELSLFSDSENSPIRKLLQQVAKETRFADWPEFVPDRIANSLAKLFGSDNPNVRLFAGIQVLARGDKPENLNAILSQYAALSGEMKKLSQDPTGSKAKDCAAGAVNESGALPGALNTIQSRLDQQNRETREALSLLFEKPVTMAWDLVLRQARGYLNDYWRNEVYNSQQQQKMEGFYPFNRNAKNSIAPSDLASFVGSQNFMALKNELKPFFRTDNFSQPKVWAGQSIGLSGEAQRAFQQGQAVANAMIQGNDIGFSFTILMRKPKARDKIDRIDVTFDGTPKPFEVSQQNAQPGQTFDLAGKKLAGGAKLQLWNRRWPRPDELVFERSFDGAWGWLKLIDEWNRRPVARNSDAEYLCEWTVTSRDGNPIQMSCTITANGSPNPLTLGFFNFRFPAQLF